MRRAVVILWAFSISLLCIFFLGSLSSASASETPGPEQSQGPSSPSETVTETLTIPPETVTATPTETATVILEPTSTATVVVTEPAEPQEPGCGSEARPCVTTVQPSSEDADFRTAMVAAAGIAIVFLAVIGLGTLRRR